MDKFIFDVDGTLTPSRGKIDEKFSQFFFDFCTLNHVYLVTGSDKPKTVEQIGNVIYGMAKRVYNCSGSEVWEGHKLIRSDNWKIPLHVKSWLQNTLEESKFSLRTGLHIEERSGMVNFSVVGRNANLEERKLYVEYDRTNNERNYIAELFNLEFKNLIARPGGETGIDISPKGADKSQIIYDFDINDTLHFYGDRMDSQGNDYPLKKVIVDENLGFAFEVDGWQDTWKKLKELK
jgi:phosphomannomutase|tara:strand:+ start:2284 stop:2988 length:705 start_codon:yes stop_codon:yes gene_type:complete